MVSVKPFSERGPAYLAEPTGTPRQHALLQSIEGAPHLLIQYSVS
jgi:hypothetical protein